MTFREHAAIAMYMAGSGPGPLPRDAVKAAQRLADEACEQWGHELDDPLKSEYCERCGKKASEF